ncbi:sulfur transferase domain-containing protein [Simiduia curdlanivorans]|uniref:Beta-lactamase hydrolase domain-containing protein n=1 Tax=Simiduia curdlanivorans TaxID=1492769 RepID=A0ABV8V721_9GAMM|nr:sulfur transferase domain-containing protein [Simiduia curdlanivorans]MDN3639061.1 sulfur transferase domain-containing protein [Simiduia curdlanivorans]
MKAVMSIKQAWQSGFGALVLLVACITALPLQAQSVEGVANFHQHSDQIATGGLVTGDALVVLKAQGYEQIIDLRSAAETPEEEGEAAKQLGLTWFNFPMTGELPSAEQIQQFGAALGDKKTLVHCRSGNRAGMAWSLWQISQGVELEQALAEGRAMGMKDGFEQAIRAQQR